ERPQGSHCDIGAYEYVPSDLDVSVDGDKKGNYDLQEQESTLQNYPTAVGGPVVIESNNGAKVVGSLLQMRRPGTSGGYTGITQLMAVPDGQLSDTYVFPYYHGTDSTRYQSIEVSNLETFDTNVTITI